ncbi:MAG: hypothetical protein HKN00_13285 [Flavobacteriaceae bacterium]|nr:hypothetical protein [Bacteroidia bacterium]NNF76152.1 hypothetical protein [Flavobacteriaceae bacterium]NNK87982.1 hypothetical protein [Flavobacteriaceae bacterium]
MIKFFRKIRQKLLTDNKFSKYFIYAIGEIILVVIGILIALQINAWNTDRNNNKLEQQYIGRLINELKEEINTYNNLKEGFKRQNEAVINLLKIWNQPRSIAIDTAQFWNDFFAGSGAGPWHKDPVIWTQLVQSGELKLITDQSVIEALFTHYANVKRTADNYNEYPTQTTNEARKLIATTFAESDFLLTPQYEQRQKPPAKVIDLIFTDKEAYQVVFVRVGIIARIHVNSMASLAGSAEDVIKMLEKNLKADD